MANKPAAAARGRSARLAGRAAGLAILATLSGCAAAGGDLQLRESIVGEVRRETAMIKAELRMALLADLRVEARAEIEARVQAQAAGWLSQQDQRAGRDLRSNDGWWIGLMVLGLILLGLSYPVGKLIWLWGSRMRHPEAAA